MEKWPLRRFIQQRLQLHSPPEQRHHLCLPRNIKRKVTKSIKNPVKKRQSALGHGTAATTVQLAVRRDRRQSQRVRVDNRVSARAPPRRTSGPARLLPNGKFIGISGRPIHAAGAVRRAKQALGLIKGRTDVGKGKKAAVASSLSAVQLAELVGQT